VTGRAEVCKACGGPLPSRRGKTCGPECGRLYYAELSREWARSPGAKARERERYRTDEAYRLRENEARRQRDLRCGRTKRGPAPLGRPCMICGGPVLKTNPRIVCCSPNCQRERVRERVRLRQRKRQRNRLYTVGRRASVALARGTISAALLPEQIALLIKRIENIKHQMEKDDG
jgi:uncharacterized Zn finger protein (UPF0148 family)